MSKLLKKDWNDATDTANFLTDSQMREIHGWSMYSKITAHYVHLTRKDVDKAMIQHYGLKTTRNKTNRPSIKCHICDNLNNPNHDTCWKCGQALSLESSMKIKKVKQLLETIQEILVEE